MGKLWPALDLEIDAADNAQADRALAIADDFGPTAIEAIDAVDELAPRLRLFFATPLDRDRAAAALRPTFHVSPIGLPDDDWARRSQENLTPITVGRVTVLPPWSSVVGDPRLVTSGSPIAGHAPPITIVVAPSMGFGTGHHATTRLCLAALQAIDLTGAVVLDVGTGSGVLAMAAVRLGAARALGLDDDPDAIQSANENLALNPAHSDSAHPVTFTVGDLMAMELPPADLVTANLTGALLIRAARRLQRAVGPGGALIVSGLLVEESDDVRRAFADLEIVGEAEEDGWTTFTARRLSNGE